MATRSRDNGTNFGWLKKSCDISTCDGNLEKYGRPMKSAIEQILQSSVIRQSKWHRQCYQHLTNQNKID